MKPEPRHLLWHQSLTKGEGGWVFFNPCSTAWYCRTLQMTTRKTKSFTSAVQSRTEAKAEQLSDWTLFEFFLSMPFIILFLLFNEWKTRKKKERKLGKKKKKKSDIWYPSLPHVSLYSPSYLWHRNRTTQMDRGELLHSPCTSPQEGKNKSTPNPKNLK